MKHVVLDTEVFRHENLAFDSPRFERLEELVNEGEVEVYVTDIVVEEVRRAIAEEVRSGVEILRKEPVRRTLNVVAQGGVPKLKELLKDLDASEIVEELTKEFDELLERLDVEVIPTDNVSSKDLRERYFKVVPPFGHKAEKKHEFPDAMTALAVEAWAATKEEPVWLVSADKGMQAAVSAMKGVTAISELRAVVDLVLRAQAVAEKAQEVAEAIDEQIQTAIKKEFETLGFYVSGEWVEVTEVSVTNVDVGTVYVGAVDDTKVTLEFEAHVEYTADISFDNPDETAYDSETGETHVYGSQRRDVEDETWIEGEMVIDVDLDDLAASHLMSLDLHANEIDVSFHMSDGDS